MYRFTLIFILCLLAPDIYIYFAHIARKTRNSLLRLSYWLPSMLLIAFFFCLIYLAGASSMSTHAQSISYMAIATLLVLVPKLVFAICSLMGVLAHALAGRCPRLPFDMAGLALAAIAFAGIVYGSLWGTTRFEVKEVEYRSPRLPKGFDGYRIVQLSDMHIGSWRGKPQAVEQVVGLANAQEADLIVFTGDLVNQLSHELDGFQPVLSRLHAPDGVYSILGNHDYGTYFRWKTPEEEKANLEYLVDQQAGMGWKLLNNAHSIIRHRGDSIAIIGVENDGEPPFSQFADLSRAMKGTEDMFQILLSHNPTHWRRDVLPNSDIPLMLAGHTHAMQLILFGHSLAELKYPEWGGMYQESGQSLYVNIGIGYVGLPFRFGAWPEITVLTLRRGQK